MTEPEDNNNSTMLPKVMTIILDYLHHVKRFMSELPLCPRK